MCEFTLPENSLHFVNDAHGIYIPQVFLVYIELCGYQLENVNNDDYAIIICGPDHDCYWEAWEQMLMTGRVRRNSGDLYELHHDQDLWLVPVEGGEL